uniref:AlwI family type II restriction endonuclease n=1 Tax=Pseudodesulfovibrio pelocollis TaxID=3051432 RepID=UPI00255ACB91
MAQKQPIWLFGNTTVRSPFRLRDCLILLSRSSMEGNLYGEREEVAFREFLGEHGIVSLAEPQKGKKPTGDLGRKWRHAMTKLGFLYPKAPKMALLEKWQQEIGNPSEISPHGWHLIEAETVSGWQECFLRSLVGLYLPMEKHHHSANGLFHPLRHILTLMKNLEQMTGECRLNPVEMALVAQLSENMTSSDIVTKEVISFREQRDKAKNKKAFDNEYTQLLAKKYSKEAGTFGDYADMNLRHLKATGLVHNQGRSIVFVPEKRFLIDKLIDGIPHPVDDIAQWKSICNGTPLPTDEKGNALVVLQSLAEQLELRGYKCDLKSRKLDTPQEISLVRYELEDLFQQLKELEYAAQQRSMAEEISAFFD